MTNRTTLILGAGFSGKTYGKLLANQGEIVFGTTRTKGNFDALSALDIQPLLFGEDMNIEALEGVLEQVTDLVISIAPDAEGDPVLRALEAALRAAPKLEWLAYLSTVGVYGNHDGAWVDETTVCKPVSVRSVQRVAAEKAWQAFAVDNKLPLSILRLSGIYGPGRNALKNMVEGKARRLVKPGQVFNRIHAADIAGSLAHLAAKRSHGIFNVTDDMPSPPQDVVAYAAFVTKIDPPPEIDFETATLSPMARSFYGENKRVSNKKIKDFGYTFQFPNYRMSLDKMWEADDWR